MRREAGFTLIELMVAVVTSGLLLGGVYSMMIRQQQSYQIQDQVVEVQQNLRSSFIFLRYDLRMVGHGLVAGTAPISSHLNNQVGVNGTDAITFMANTGAASVVMPGGAAWNTTFKFYPLASGAPVTIPVHSVIGFPVSTPYQVDLVDLSNGTLVANANITAVTQNSPPIPSTLTLVPCPVVACPPLSLSDGSYIGQSPQAFTYQVDVSGTGSPDCKNPPCLERIVGGAVSVLAEGVEDFQIAYGFDGINGFPADGVIKENGIAANDDEWVFNSAGDSWPILASDIDKLRAIRVSLQLKTTNRDPGYTGGTTGILEDHTWTSPLDGYRRRVIRFIENVRNLSFPS